jgi:hypothetical protein
MSEQRQVDDRSPDAVLGPKWHQIRGGEPFRVASALLLKGMGRGLTTDVIRDWIGRRVSEQINWAGGIRAVRQESDVDPSRPNEGAALIRSYVTLQGFINSNPRWAECVSWSERKARSKSSGAIREDHLVAANWMLAGVLLALPQSAGALLFRRSVNARVAVAATGRRKIADDIGMATVLVSYTRIAAEHGYTRQLVARTFDDLCSAGLLTKTAGGKRVTGRFLLSNVEKNRLTALDRFADTASAIVDGRNAALANLILSVDHPAWTYSDSLSHKHWLLLLADSAGVSVRDLGISIKLEREVRAELDGALLTTRTLPQLNEILEHHADDDLFGTMHRPSGEWLTPRAAKERAMEAYRASAEQEWWTAKQFNEVKSLVHTQLTQTFSGSLAIPPAPYLGRTRDERDDRSEELIQWLLRSHDAARKNWPDDEHPTERRDYLLSKLISRKYGAAFSAQIVDYVLDGWAVGRLAEELQEAREILDDDDT